MSQPLDPEVIREQLEKWKADRDRLDQAIAALQQILNGMEGRGIQRLLALPSAEDAEISLLDAVRGACMKLVDGITRQRVIQTIERMHPFLAPNPSSVAAALLNLSKGPNPLLHLAEPGSGSRPAVYSTEGEMVLKLNSEEIAALNDIRAIRGVGGWQSLWKTLRCLFSKADGTIRLDPARRARILHYYKSYGIGGWQNKVRSVFKRHLPHMFE